MNKRKQYIEIQVDIKVPRQTPAEDTQIIPATKVLNHFLDEYVQIMMRISLNIRSEYRHPICISKNNPQNQ